MSKSLLCRDIRFRKLSSPELNTTSKSVITYHGYLDVILLVR